MSPSIFIHIGRSKTGSTTIQSLVTVHRAFMEEAGVFCPLTVEGQNNHAPLAAALSGRTGDGPSLEKFREDLWLSRSGKMFLSAETLCEIPEAGVHRLKDLLAGRDVKFLLYVREYPGWVVSRYAQAVRFATRADDFDSYFKALRKRVSIVPALRQWVAAFGRDALHVRPLDPSALAGGSLISDVLHVIGVTAPPPEVPPLALSPHWIMLELQRALVAAAAAAPIGKVDRRSGRVMRQLLEECVREVRPSRVQYLTRAQWHDLADLYRADMKVIGELAGMSIPVSLAEPGERPFLPSFGAVPRAVRRAMLSKLQAQRPAHVHPAILELAVRLLTND